MAAHIAALAQLTASRAAAAVADATGVSDGLPDTAAWGSKVLQAAENELGRFVEQVGSCLLNLDHCHIKGCCSKRATCTCMLSSD